MVSLIMSLAFGLAQVAAGCAVAIHLVRRRAWRSAGSYLLLTICLWFVCSGLAELAVSGMELAKTVGAGPSAATFSLWRGRADAVLLFATLALVTSLPARHLVAKMWRRRPARQH